MMAEHRAHSPRQQTRVRMCLYTLSGVKAATPTPQALLTHWLLGCPAFKLREVAPVFVSCEWQVRSSLVFAQFCQVTYKHHLENDRNSVQ